MQFNQLSQINPAEINNMYVNPTVGYQQNLGNFFFSLKIFLLIFYFEKFYFINKIPLKKISF